ncbi:glutathione-dependent formaldehyde dehydrogenase [Bradyrhizobium lablabi]|uniref:zinc-dependent alcohol dehydrogenase n=1 Tax=Bradyrhizobium lablabi TaxID=722472 RepID=UPI001BAC435E|nr:zinc-dependent alcohol dehydrogenase [Bradyrhizobium lablabi]MBR1124532.1 glutathione-dependent formaldehyde dehydrogenase [Bradyrhizobium lablabi]
MKALVYHGRGDVRCEAVPDPMIEEGRDAIIKVTACAICGSDLHLIGGFVPEMKSGDLLGHECMGEVVEVGCDNKRLKIGDRVVIPFCLACGECRMCKMELYSCCEKSNRNGADQAKSLGYPVAGALGYSHMTGGYAGGQAEYVRVPFADFGAFVVPQDFSDEQVLFLSDIFPTGYMAAENCDIKKGQTVAVWGCGPVGLFSIMSAFVLGAERVIAIDTVKERIELARRLGAEVIDYKDGNVHEQILGLTKGQGPDAVIEAVGMESLGSETAMQAVASAVQSTISATDRPYALNQAIMSCRPGGVVSVPGVYIGSAVATAMGAFMNKGLTMKTGQTHVHRYLKKLMRLIEEGKVDPTLIISHRTANLEDGPNLYETFQEKKDGCVKVVMFPHGRTSASATRPAEATAPANP